jgi:hypothetical protein
MAPGRFAASINQAPLWRRTEHPWLRPFDHARMRSSTWRCAHMPPDQCCGDGSRPARDSGERAASAEDGTSRVR